MFSLAHLSCKGGKPNFQVLTCIPVLSTLNAKFPFPTCRGVVVLSMRLVRTTLN